MIKALFSTPLVGPQIGGWVLLIILILIIGACIYLSIDLQSWEPFFTGLFIDSFGMFFVVLLFSIGFSNRNFYTDYPTRFNYLNGRIEELQDYNTALQTKVSNTLVESGSSSMKDYNNVLNTNVTTGQKHTKDSMEVIYKDFSKIIYDHESNQFMFENGEELHTATYGG